MIDCCPLLNVLSLNAMFAADLLLIPVSADYLALQGAQQVERALNALEPVFKRRLPRRYLLTRYDAPAQDERRSWRSGMAEAFRPDEICATRIRENVKLAESPAVGLDIFRARARQPGRARLREPGGGVSECRLSELTAARRLIRPMTRSTSRVSSRRGTDCSRQSMISQWWYIWRRRRSASTCDPAMMEMFSTRCPVPGLDVEAVSNHAAAPGRRIRPHGRCGRALMQDAFLSVAAARRT